MSMENNVEVSVIIYTVKLSLPKEKLEDMYDDNPILGIIANKVKASLEKEDIEV